MVRPEDALAAFARSMISCIVRIGNFPFSSIGRSGLSRWCCRSARDCDGDEHAVLGQMHVPFQGVCTGGHRRIVGGLGLLRVKAGQSAMANDEGLFASSVRMGNAPPPPPPAPPPAPPALPPAPPALPPAPSVTETGDC